MKRGAPENAGRAAADVTDGAIGHRVADLVREDLFVLELIRDGVTGVVAHERTIAVERETDAVRAIRIVLVLPAPVLDRPGRVERAREEIEDRRLVAALIGPDRETRLLLSVHASARPSGSGAR